MLAIKFFLADKVFLAISPLRETFLCETPQMLKKIPMGIAIRDISFIKSQVGQGDLRGSMGGSEMKILTANGQTKMN